MLKTTSVERTLWAIASVQAASTAGSASVSMAAPIRRPETVIWKVKTDRFELRGELRIDLRGDVPVERAGGNAKEDVMSAIRVGGEIVE
jgi:hypothetical protein